MKIGFVADAHGAPEGLEICMDLLKKNGAEKIYFLGDAIGYFPDEGHVLELLKKYGAVCIKGNHEAMLLGKISLRHQEDEFYRISEAGKRLGKSELDEITSWPEEVALEIEGRRIQCMHGKPGDRLQGYFYPDSNPAELSSFDADLLVMAHTHRPFVYTWRGKLILNPGSSSLPRQGGGRGSCAIYDSVVNKADHLWVNLEVGKIMEKYRGKMHPKVLETLLRYDVN